MDKYVELLCKQNPKMTLKCGNSECNHEFTVISKDVFNEKKYKLTCPECNKETVYDTSKFADDFKRQLKESGISLK